MARAPAVSINEAGHLRLFALFSVALRDGRDWPGPRMSSLWHCPFCEGFEDFVSPLSASTLRLDLFLGVPDI